MPALCVQVLHNMRCSRTHTTTALTVGLWLICGDTQPRRERDGVAIDAYCCPLFLYMTLSRYSIPTPGTLYLTRGVLILSQ